MPTDEQKAHYAANRSAKRRADKYEAMPETQALRSELKALQQSIAGERALPLRAENRMGMGAAGVRAPG